MVVGHRGLSSHDTFDQWVWPRTSTGDLARKLPPNQLSHDVEQLLTGKIYGCVACESREEEEEGGYMHRPELSMYSLAFIL